LENLLRTRSKCHNLELFSDEERAVVGTAYKQESKKGLSKLVLYVKPKLNDFVTKSVAIASNKEVAIHCWRGE
jgi:tRNA 2-selenouridine synthase